MCFRQSDVWKTGVSSEGVGTLSTPLVASLLQPQQASGLPWVRAGGHGRTVYMQAEKRHRCAMTQVRTEANQGKNNK